MIRKLQSGEYRLYSRKVNPKTGKRRNLGTFKSRAAAEKHERAVQYFKQHGWDIGAVRWCVYDRAAAVWSFHFAAITFLVEAHHEIGVVAASPRHQHLWRTKINYAHGARLSRCKILLVDVSPKDAAASQQILASLPRHASLLFAEWGLVNANGVFCVRWLNQRGPHWPSMTLGWILGRRHEVSERDGWA
jgi:hypothetical protein